MKSRKRVLAASMGAAVVMLSLLLLGGGPSPSFGDPFPKLPANLLARFVAGQAQFLVPRHAPDRARARLQQQLVRCLSLHRPPLEEAAPSLRPGTGR